MDVLLQAERPARPGSQTMSQRWTTCLICSSSCGIHGCQWICRGVGCGWLAHQEIVFSERWWVAGTTFVQAVKSRVTTFNYIRRVTAIATQFATAVAISLIRSSSPQFTMGPVTKSLPTNQRSLQAENAVPPSGRLSLCCRLQCRRRFGLRNVGHYRSPRSLSPPLKQLALHNLARSQEG